MKLNRKIIKRIMISAALIIGLVSISVFAYMQHPKFGRKPQGARLERMKLSPHFRDGVFHNLSYTPVMAEGVSYLSVVWDFIFKKVPNAKPERTIPSVKSDLKQLDINKDIVIWFGHSSYFIQLAGKRFLVDPVFSGSASPVSFTTKAFDGANTYSAEDMPQIDYLIITHDHWDHLDYETVLKLKSKVRNVICGLGVGEYFEYWGYDVSKIIEKDWFETIDIGNNFSIHTMPTRHFSGRTFVRNRTLWMAFIMQTPDYKIYLSGDGGYDKHFKAAGERFGEFDLAILENGQYNPNWKYIHSLPKHVIQEANDLKVKRMLPTHSSKFVLALHPWAEPLDTISNLSKNESFQLLTPVIGEVVNLRDSNYHFKKWWREVK